MNTARVLRDLRAPRQVGFNCAILGLGWSAGPVPGRPADKTAGRPWLSAKAEVAARVNPQSPLSILVFAAAPAESTHEYLLLRRIPSRGGFWQGISGGVEAGETLDEAAIRELAEETSLTPTRLLAVGHSYTFLAKKRAAATSSPSQRVTEHVFLALLSARVDPTIDPAEHDAWDWFAFEDALMWLRWPENMEGLRRCERLISPGPPSRSA